MYYIEKDNIVIGTNEDREEFIAILKYRPDLKEDDIKEVPEGYVAVVGKELITQEEYQTEQEQAERERIAMLNMTGADVERAIYKVKGIDFDDILAIVKDNPVIDEKALKIEFKANNFFRGNPYIEQVGLLLGFTEDMLDKFFDTKDYQYLTTKTLTINATPTEATVTGTGAYPYGTLVDYKVELEGYKPYIGRIELLKDTELNIKLEKIEEVVDENTTSIKEDNTIMKGGE